MKPATFFLGLATSTSANIIFNHVPLNCSWNSARMYNGCLRGQECTEYGE